MKKIFIIILSIILFNNLFAHEGEEEVEVKNAPRFGGRVSAIVLKEDHGHEKESDHAHKEKEEHHDEALFMSELLISDEDVVRFYVYDDEMKAISLADFPSELSGSIVIKKKDKVINQTLLLKKESKYYVGSLPNLEKKPYDLNIEFKHKGKKLVVSFKSLD